jgi:hypothetical protein
MKINLNGFWGLLTFLIVFLSAREELQLREVLLAAEIFIAFFVWSI